MTSGSHTYDYIHHVCTGLLLAPLLCYASTKAMTLIWIATFIVWTVVDLRRQRRFKVHIGGDVEPGFERVRDVFKSLLESRQERGGAFCVYYEGRPVVDLWGGYADHASLRLRQADSTQMFYSVTKAVTAIVMAVLVDRGLLDYDAPISRYWPEFAGQGKEKIDVKTLLSHQAGLIAIRKWHKLALVRDNPHEMGRLLAEETPMWEPGKGQGYHTLTLGLYADQLVRRVDPKGRSLAQYFEMEIARPFGLEIWIGEPKHMYHRACRETRAYFGLWHIIHTVIPTSICFVLTAIYSVLRWGKIYLLYFVGNPTDWLPRRLNDPEYRQVPSPASHGFGTVHSLAKLMGIVANGGTLRGQTLLSSERCRMLATVLTNRLDRVVLRKIAYGPGLMVEEVHVDGKKEKCFGHWGAGGQMVFADDSRPLAWAYCTTYNNMLHGYIQDHRYMALREAVYRCMREVEAKHK